MTSILFIAPHEEIAATAQMIIKKMHIDIPVITASNQAAVNAAITQEQISIIISRGGTARDLRQYTNKIIVELHTSFIDISTAIEKIAAAGSKNIAIVSTDNILENASNLFNFGDINIKFCPCKDDNHIIKKIQELSNCNIDGIIGDIQAVKTAHNLQIKNSIYIDSGILSITKAIEEALALDANQRNKQLRLKTMQAIIDNIDEGIIGCNQEQKIIFSNKEGQKILSANPAFFFDNYSKRLIKDLEEYKGKVIELNSEKILLDLIELNITNEYKNNILIFQKVSNIENSARRIRTALQQKGLYAKKKFSDIKYSSKEMAAVITLAQRFANSNSNILIYGETGTGKEGLAQSIHNSSPRRNNPFVSVNCASLPPTLIESELFGYVDGAFTGARRSGKKGLFELAHTGTIFLDEIGDLPLDIQSRLLRVLQEREIMRIGDDKIMPIDIRIICATNKNLKQLIKNGLFRQDLYYRINVLRLSLPPLRERQEDIMPLIYFYLHKYLPAKNSSKPNFPENIIKYLKTYSWPGNVRELKNMAEALAFSYPDNLNLCAIKTILDDAAMESPDNSLKIPIVNDLKEMEKNILQQLLDKYSPDEVCQMLKISRVTLWRKCK